MSKLICPHCDKDILDNVQDPSDWLYNMDLYQEVTKDFTCPLCKGYVVVEAYTTFTYETHKDWP